ncbi:gluconokinase, GntK/IdnK-type [Actinocrispum wychmicini]|uniref:gluconokinase n=1 Tax=Actinocrispum wychmicini TaxID=1213861 RepID=A0A4R2JP27_9PSEU|nr:gluconokinase, GntK/IdnK-type [Actinocrispum wychmicini]TCO61134.1 2-oxopent-4-enoate hydratase [Actinocrispum wychmicini]
MAGQRLVIMGVAGCGKSTIGRELASFLGWRFVEGDDLHPAANVAKMANGEPLGDADRLPWLHVINANLCDQPDVPTILTCSALKALYREVLRQAGDVRFVHLQASEATLRTRIASRVDHFMQADMLTSQLADLEPLGAGEKGATFDAERPVSEVVAEILSWTDRQQVISQAAQRLATAARTGVPTSPVRDLLGRTDIALAYEVQNVLTAERLAAGARVVGRKIGLTSPAVQAQLGVDQPDFGVLFDDMHIGDCATVEFTRLIHPKAEAEIAFVLAHDLDGFAAGTTLGSPVSGAERAAAAAAVGHAVGALEIVDSRIVDWDIAITDTVADNASSGLFVLGNEQARPDRFVPADVTMTLRKNGRQVSAGTGAACLGDPLNALAWLARATAAFGDPLRAGDVVLSGALGPMVPVAPGDELIAELSTLGRVRVTFSQEEEP